MVSTVMYGNKNVNLSSPSNRAVKDEYTGELWRLFSVSAIKNLKKLREKFHEADVRYNCEDEYEMW